MNALPPSFPPPGDVLAAGTSGAVLVRQHPGQSYAMKWEALHEAAEVVAMLAGVDGSVLPRRIREFPHKVSEMDDWRRHLAEQGIDDLAAIMEPGIEALLTVNENGVNTTAPATALWQEFTSAREALLSLIPPA